jgi:flagellar assembly protein FliH
MQMPSSPETVKPAYGFVHAWEPRELSGPASAAAAAPSLRAVIDTVPVFELSSSSGIPAALFDPARAAAEAKGYAAGWATGIQSARLAIEVETEQRRSEAAHDVAANRLALARAVKAIQAAAEVLSRRAVPAAEQFEDLIISTAFSIAEALVDVTLRDDLTRGSAALTRALALAPDGTAITVALSPQDHAVLTADGAAPPSPRQGVTLIADPMLAPGDAYATSAATSIDARISTGLARVRAVLAA